jgi:hypothetical protein
MKYKGKRNPSPASRERRANTKWYGCIKATLDHDKNTATLTYHPGAQPLNRMTHLRFIKWAKKRLKGWKIVDLATRQVRGE